MFFLNVLLELFETTWFTQLCDTHDTQTLILKKSVLSVHSVPY